MLRIALSVIGGLMLIVSVGAWYFYQEVLIVWISILFNLVKGVTLKSVLGWLAFLMRRWLLIEVPKYMILILLTIGAPIRWRAAIRLFARKLRLRIADVRKRVQAYFTTRIGKRAAITIAVLASTAVFFVGILYFGIYILYFIGGGPIFTALLSYLSLKAQQIAFKTVMFLQLDRLGRFVIARLPQHSRERLTSTVVESRRKVIARRKAVVDRMQGAFMTRRRVRLSGVSATVEPASRADRDAVAAAPVSRAESGADDAGQGAAEGSTYAAAPQHAGRPDAGEGEVRWSTKKSSEQAP